MSHAALVLLALTLGQSVSSQTAVEGASLKPASFEMTIKGGILGTVSVRAKGVETKAIVSSLGQQLKIPVDATPIVSAHKVDLTMTQASINEMLLMLAPVVLVDQELSWGQDPVWTAIHLAGYNEKEPPGALKQTGFLIFAGVPPESADESAEELEARADATVRQSLDEPEKDQKPVLIVSVAADKRVSLRARQQPLIAILNEVAAKAKAPIDLRGEVDMGLVDADIKDIPLRDIGVALGRGGFKLVVRRNLATGDETVQGILVGDPAKPRQP